MSARYPHPFKYNFGIPTFDMAHKFVYMNDLVNPQRMSRNHYVNHLKQELYEQASDQVNSLNAMIGSKDNEAVQSALQFLLNTAESERNKELDIIRDYSDDLRKRFPDNKEINHFLDHLDAKILDDPQKLTDFYNNLTKCLNVIRNKTDEYRQLLKDFQKHKKRTMDTLAQDKYQFRARSDIQSLLNNITGMALKSQNKIIDNYSASLRQSTYDYMISSGLMDRLTSGVDIAAAFAAVSQDIAHIMQRELDSRGEKDFKDLIPSMGEIMEKYKSADEKSQTNLQKAINSNENELARILDSAKKVLNIQLVDESQRTKRANKVKDRSSRMTLEASLYKQLKQIYTNNPAINELKYVEFSVGSKQTGHGKIAEMLHVIQTGDSVKIASETGADSLHLGSFYFEFLPVDIQEQLTPVLNEISDALKKYDLQDRESRMDDMQKIEDDLNDEIETAIKKLDDTIKDLDIPLTNLFVYHESLKMYMSAQTGQLGGQGFHGRDMRILSYFDKMYSADGLAGLELPDREKLDFMALNLASGAVGGGNKGTMENYLSIFAGLLMFDDIKLIAQDAAQHIANEAGGIGSTGITKQIHMYNLNGVYVPASMILSFIHESMKDISNAVIDGRVAKAHINTSGADDAIKDYLATRPLPIREQWQKVAEKVASGTSVKITILSSFNSLLSGLGI